MGWKVIVQPHCSIVLFSQPLFPFVNLPIPIAVPPLTTTICLLLDSLVVSLSGGIETAIVLTFLFLVQHEKDSSYSLIDSLHGGDSSTLPHHSLEFILLTENEDSTNSKESNFPTSENQYTYTL